MARYEERNNRLRLTEEESKRREEIEEETSRRKQERFLRESPQDIIDRYAASVESRTKIMLSDLDQYNIAAQDRIEILAELIVGNLAAMKRLVR